VVTGVGTRPTAALIAAVLAAAILVACGGSDSDSSSTTSATSGSVTPRSTAQSGSQGNSAERSPAQSGGESQKNGRGQGSGEQGGGFAGKSVKEIATPLKVSGGGSTQFLVKGGDNSVQEFGDEGDESELQKAAEVVHGFYVSRAAEEWDKACSYLAKANIEQLEQLASQSPQLKGAGCAPILKAFTRPVPASVNREVTTVDAGSLRHEGEQGFLIYYGAGHATYTMPLREEDGTWKVTALSGTTLG
jgi:hypothetical protein